MYRKYTTYLQYWLKKESKKPLLLLGARQVGKTYLIENFAKTSPHQFHSFDFEKQPVLHSLFENSLEPARIISGIELLLDIKIGNDDLIIFDEIQACPRALTTLKIFSSRFANQKHHCRRFVNRLTPRGKFLSGRKGRITRYLPYEFF